MLLVLDNFEQVMPAARSVAALLAECSYVRALVTSREGLCIQGERIIRVAPLAHAAAVSLFVARAQSANPHFKPTDESLRATEALCLRLDGLPLAIELVAARVKLMTPQALLARLAGTGDHLRIGLVAGGLSDLPSRQHTMREAIAWSYHLLAPEEQIVFCRLSAFVGGSDLRAIEQVVTDPRERSVKEVKDAIPSRDDILVATWNALTSLLDKNLLIQTKAEDGEPRFSMLETIREFA